jgi:hypothetical protein
MNRSGSSGPPTSRGGSRAKEGSVTVVESVNGKTGIVTLTASNVEAVPTSEVGKPNGVAELNSETKLPESQLPASVVSGREQEGAALTGRPTLNFEGGVVASDNAGANRTDINVLDEALWASDPRFAGGVKASNTPAENTAAFKAWIEEIEATGREGRLPAGKLKYEGKLKFPPASIVKGIPGGTVLEPQSITSGVELGNGTAANQGGRLQDFIIRGSTKPLTKNSEAALRLNAVRNVVLDNIELIQGFDIGLDAIGNCYGTDWRNVRVTSEGFNVACNLREGPESGSDHTFIDCWFSGVRIGVSISGSGGGFHFIGGQVNAGEGLSSAEGELGAVVLGKDYLTGATGAVGSIDFNGTNFEGTQWVWMIRQFAEGNPLFTACAFNASSSTAPCLGMWKGEAVLQSTVTFIAPRIVGTYSEAKLLQVVTPGSTFEVFEEGTTSERLTIDGASTTVHSMLAQSEFVRGQGFYTVLSTPIWVTNGTLIRANSRVFERSTNWGSTWRSDAAVPRNFLNANESTAAEATTGVTATNATLTRSTTVVPEPGRDPASFNLEATADGNVNLKSSEKEGIVAGTSYTATALELAAATARTGRIEIAWYEGSTFLSASVGATLAGSTSEWQPWTVMATAPAKATKALVEVAIFSAAEKEVHNVARTKLVVT